ncbi:unnamed protein product [Vitrella brassicaformis CCMP3155]|uniref:Uncharacterized protein n=1 Tax=Vitrella brassicaformis (strain CCMP3155) TaxID=1169540 RepID=A0A0G4ERP1_VITBC|nr:unnamed protein product [Vitrella brassicaformis CCMP3155]|eukprot:CEM00704.1 unnamed protein product [Vitrella brassicaformis CCMP3155]
MTGSTLALASNKFVVYDYVDGVDLYRPPSFGAVLRDDLVAGMYDAFDLRKYYPTNAIGVEDQLLHAPCQ